MGLANLAVVFAPTLFYIKGHKGEKMLQEVEIQVSTATTLQIMIDFREIFAKGGCVFVLERDRCWL
eukprot:m.674779 g.674779  ORF g.674779 m.674779 type:complete len:66 (+) comp58551_c0_seq64:1043-1240(+)